MWHTLRPDPSRTSPPTAIFAVGSIGGARVGSRSGTAMTLTTGWSGAARRCIRTGPTVRGQFVADVLGRIRSDAGMPAVIEPIPTLI